MISLTEENYLKAMYHLSPVSGEVSVNELSKLLDIKMPTVNSMMKKLSLKKLVHYQSYKPMRLTEKGRREAALIVRKHRLTEMFLVEKMGFRWEQVHAIAEQVEHVQSPEFFEKMDELLHFPRTDPHGSPIPDKNGKIIPTHYVLLSDCTPGDKVILSAVTHSSDDFLKYLNSRDLRLGLVITVKSVEPYDGSMVCNCGSRKNQVFSQLVCSKLLVQKEV
jgi:DtxR family transcriptional regulator, Mn-dependent transcriptional regulator